MAHDVFISYSSEDKAVADAVCATLEGQKIRCWIAPRDVLPGTAYAEALNEALQGSCALVLVLSTFSNASKHVMREIESAVNRGIPIVPFRIEDVQPSKSLNYFLKGIHWLDALSPPLEEHLQTLAQTVQRLLSQQDPARAAGAPESVAARDRRTGKAKGTAVNRSLLPVTAATPVIPDALKWGILAATVLIPLLGPLLGIIVGLIYLNDREPEKQAAGKIWLFTGVGALLLHCLGCGCLSLLPGLTQPVSY